MRQLATPFKCCARSGLVSLVLALILSGLLTAVAAAHALLVRSEPEDGAVLAQSPAQVVTWFSQELNTRLSTLQVFDAEGRQVVDGDGGVNLNDPEHASMIVSHPALPAGTHTAHWIAVSAEDDDLTEGEFTFSVGEAETGQVSASAISPLRQTQNTTASAGDGSPVGWIATGLGALLLLVGGVLAVRRRLN